MWGPPSFGNIAHGPREAAVRVGHGVGGGRVRISPPDSRCGGSERVGNESRAASPLIELKAGRHQRRHLSNYRQAKVFTVAVQAIRR